jgi:integrase/recombinase XerD
MGKGRKERATPLTALTVAAHQGGPRDPLFATRTGTRLSRDALEHRLTGYLAAAAATAHHLRGKHVSIHTLRHTCAMRLLESGTDVAVIALWLGHEKLASVQTYLHADMAQKERAIARVIPPGTRPGRYRPTDPLLAFLEQL